MYLYYFLIRYYPLCVKTEKFLVLVLTFIECTFKIAFYGIILFAISTLSKEIPLRRNRIELKLGQNSVLFFAYLVSLIAYWYVTLTLSKELKLNLKELILKSGVFLI